MYQIITQKRSMDKTFLYIKKHLLEMQNDIRRKDLFSEILSDCMPNIGM